MTPADQAIWDSGINYLKGIDTVGFSKVKSKLDNLEESEKTTFVSCMKKVDSYFATYVYVTDWTTAARAWQMYKLTPYIGIGFVAPSPQELDGLLRPLQGTTAADIRTMIQNAMSGKEILNAIHTGMQTKSRDMWDVGAFTSPAGHNPATFRYLVHAMIVDFGYTDPQKIQYQQDHGRGAFVSGGRLKVAELYFQKPDFLRSEVLCCSILTPEKASTYRRSPFGYILRVPKQNIVQAWPRDASSANTTAIARGDELKTIATPLNQAAKIEEFLEGIAAYYNRPLSTPDEIIGATGEGHNEIAVLGATPPGSFVVPSGVFVKTSTDGKLAQELLELDTDGELSRVMKNSAATQNIPIVNIPDRSVRASPIDFQTWVRS